MECLGKIGLLLASKMEFFGRNQSDFNMNNSTLEIPDHYNI